MPGYNVCIIGKCGVVFMCMCLFFMEFMPDMLRMSCQYRWYYSTETKQSLLENLYLKRKWDGQTHAADQLSTGNELHELPSVCICKCVWVFDWVYHTARRASMCVASVSCEYIYLIKTDEEEQHNGTNQTERKKGLTSVLLSIQIEFNT